ncbi:hypothetical protein M408DRAFT_331711 [Serendipita vermifera MAFF 305830]|uniref:Uncharacterized protein n=1 Tax=Serendipita vermifera MAFF 305830 TaxID=933852 RepID=A0A0C2WDV1_SERVB|nr:hypothetical protein M408DRAFT_331711 [Serendipita vermifera MAFF 305830]
MSSPPTSPPTSPTPTRIPKPKGNRLTKSPSNAKRDKSPARAKSPSDSRTSLQMSGSQTPPSGGTFRRLSLSSRSATLPSQPKQPPTPTINISFAGSMTGGGNPSVQNLSASASNASFFTPALSDSPHSSASPLPASNRTSPHTSWVPGAPYMPGINATTLAAIAAAPERPQPPHGQMPQPFPTSASESNLIPPQGLLGPLLARESLLRARERERAASLGMATPPAGSSRPGSMSHPAGYFGQMPASDQAGQIHGLLEASGLLEGQQQQRGRYDSVTNSNSSIWTMRDQTGGGDASSSSASHPAQHQQQHEDDEDEAWFKKERMLDGMSSMTHDTSAHAGDATLSSTELASHFPPNTSTGNLGENTQTPRPSSPSGQKDAPATVGAASGAKLSKSTSLRSTLPSIRSFRNPFSFSRSASTSAATATATSTSKEQEKSREREKSSERAKSKERSKSKERGSILPLGHKSQSGSNVSLPSTNRHVYTPISQRTPATPAAMTAAAAFAAQIQSQAQVQLHVVTPPRASGDTILPGTRLHGSSPSLSIPASGSNPILNSSPSPSSSKTSSTSSPSPAPWPTPTPAMAARFGFSGRGGAGRHSMDSPVGYSYGRLGTMFAGTGPGSNASGPLVGRAPVMTGYANGSRERVVLDQHQQSQGFQQSHGHSSSIGALGLGRVSPGPGRGSPAFGPLGGTGITGLVRPPGLDSHMELDERSLRTDRTESGYGFGGIQISGDGIMLSPVDDDDEPFDLREEDEEEDVRALLGSGIFEGEYESTEGHAAPASMDTHGIPNHHAMVFDDDNVDEGTVHGHRTFDASKIIQHMPPPVDAPSSYPYPTAYPQDESPDTSTEHHTTTAEPKLPPGLEQFVQQAETEKAEEPSSRDLLGELARQLQRVVDQQSPSTAPHTPSSILQLESGGGSGSSQGGLHSATKGDEADEFGRWSVGELKGAVERMKALIDEQEKRMRQPVVQRAGHQRAKNSISLNDSPPPLQDASLVSEKTVQQPPPPDNGQTTPRRRPSNSALPGDGTKQKESRSSSSATAASTALVTPTTPHDGPSFPLPSMKIVTTGSGHDRVQSFDFTSLDADLVAMLSPNHMTSSESDERKEDDTMASSALLRLSSVSYPTQDVFGPGSEETHTQTPVRSAPMGGDLTIATIASDGFGSMRSDKSVEEILLQRNFDYDQTGVVEEEAADQSRSSMILDALALEPAATSSPPRKKVHTPRASSVSALPVIEKREKSSTLFPVMESQDSAGNSPSKTSPSRSPLSKARGKDRLPLPQFESDSNLLEANESAGNKAGRISPSPRPPSRSQQSAISPLGYNRRPPSRTSATGEGGSTIDRLRRSVTSGSDSFRSLNPDGPRHQRLQSITGSQSDTPPSRLGLDLSLGPRTARAFAAAGVLESGPSSAPSSRVGTWRSASVMGYRRDGVERDFGNASGARSLASSPIPMIGAPGPSGAAARRLVAHDRELYRGADAPRARAISDAWSRPIFSRTPETALRNLNINGTSTDPSGTSSPTSSAPPRTTLSSSTSSHLPTLEVKPYKAPSVTADSNTAAHQAAIATLKERHELEKEALLSALSEAKKESRLERAAKEELALELTEMGTYVEELETKLGEALARMRWMEKEIGILKDAVGVAKRGSPAQSAIRQSIENKRLQRLGSPAPSSHPDDNVFGSHLANSRAAESPLRTQIRINHVPASPDEQDDSRRFPTYEEDQSPLRNKSHRRISSDASSIAVPRIDQSMSMLLQENGYGQGYDGASLYSMNDGSPPSSPKAPLGRATSLSGEATSVNNGRLLTAGATQRSFGHQTPTRNRKNHPPSTIMEMSPTTTTADYSIHPGSPGSLVLRPEDEHHLGDLLSLMGSDDGL